MRDLVESILLGDNVEASKLFESHMESIVEKKLYEKKRMVQAESQYSASTQQGLKSGKRLLTPKERSGLSVDPSIKPGGIEHPTGVTSSNRKAPPSQKKKSVASGYKKLADKGTVVPRTLNIGDRYEKALSQAKDLESRGSTGKVAAVKKVYRPYRAAKAVTGAIKGAAHTWGNILQKGMSGPLEE
jgi:hypothetical protein